jgi:hypothetical protein
VLHAVCFATAADVEVEYVEIVFYTKVLTVDAQQHMRSLLDGYPCNSMLELLVHTIAHEMGHVIQDSMMFSGKYHTFARKQALQYHDAIFANLVRNLFGHPMGATSSTWQAWDNQFVEPERAARDNTCGFRGFHERP